MKARLDSLTGVRIFAAVWVMLYHFRYITPTEVWKYPVVDPLIRQGFYGVDLFFVLSGFILSHVYFAGFAEGVNRERVRQFIGFRFARLYPVHLATFGIMVALFLGERVVVGASSVEATDRYSPVSVLTTLTMTHAWVAGVETPNLPAWSISAEWFAYLLFPLLCAVAVRLRHAMVPAFVGIALMLALSFELGAESSLIRVVAGFILGMAVYRVALRCHARGFQSTPWMGALFAVLIGLWVLLSDAPRLEIGLLLFAGLIWALTFDRDWLSKSLAHPVVVYLGEVSYSLYMFHWIARVVVRVGGQKVGLSDVVPAPVIVLVEVAVTFLGAVLLYHWVERPGRRALRRLSAGRATAEPTV